ncbi:MAG: TlpA family protein disulfide reductase [Chitinophagales bacterium]|nr:TlpA family protein disulfide reductase [Chitinophagales bacterium]
MKYLNLIFYIVFALGIALFLKRKFYVPSLEKEKLVLTSYEGEAINLTEKSDKVLVLNFWQTWCGPCKQEMPSLNEMSTVWQDLEVYAISDEPLEKVASYMTKYPEINFVHIESIEELGITQYPTTYILNKKGVKVYSKIGTKDWADPNFIASLKKNWEN